MLALELDEFLIELKDGAIQNVGPSNKSASAKLFDVESADAREFGDKRVKLVFEDDDGNELQVSLFPDELQSLWEDIEHLEAESEVFE